MTLRSFVLLFYLEFYIVVSGLGVGPVLDGSMRRDAAVLCLLCDAVVHASYIERSISFQLDHIIPISTQQPVGQRWSLQSEFMEELALIEVASRFVCLAGQRLMTATRVGPAHSQGTLCGVDMLTAHCYHIQSRCATALQPTGVAFVCTITVQALRNTQV